MSGPRATVLVADDNAANRALAEAALDDENYRVVLVDDGEAAVAAFVREAPDCVLLDVRMPGLDGPAACERIRALPGGAEVPIVFVTALRDVETFDRAVTAGGDDYLTKPYRPAELVARVAAALKLRRLAAERSDLYAQIKQQRDDLQRLQLQREDLIAFLVHDLKNPVNAIDLQAQLLLRDRDSSERSRRVATAIRDEGRHLLRMITTLLDVARADAGQLAPVRQRVELDALAAVVMDEFAVQAAAAGVQLAREAAVELEADPDLLRRVLENLVENAIRHAPEGTEVHLSARTVDGGVELRVRDAGPGVPVEHRVHVFERFAQAGVSAARGNRGLGLAFCKLAVAAHGGRIWIEDAAPGAAFCLWLPPRAI